MQDLTIIDIARLAGVSVSTVSRVLNRHPDVSAETSKRVMAVIEEHHYVPNDSARNLKRESMKAVAVVVKGFSNPFFTAMLGIIQQELERNSYIMLLAQVETDQNEVAAAVRLCKEKKPHGVIFMGGNFRHAQGRLAQLNVPFVMLTITMHGKADRAGFSSITVDDYAAGRNVAHRIIEGGHKSLAVIGSNADDISISRLRLDGFCQEAKASGLPLPKAHIAYAGEFSHKAGYEAAKTLLQNASFTCLFCISDILALGAMRAMHDARLAVPGDISIVGFDGIAEGRYYIPSLATMNQPGSEMAHESVRLLLGCIQNGAPHEHKLFEASFTGGESFAARP
jgi:LacI family transcriptional regulator